MYYLYVLKNHVICGTHIGLCIYILTLQILLHMIVKYTREWAKWAILPPFKRGKMGY